MPATSVLPLADRTRPATRRTLRRRAATIPAALVGAVIVAPVLVAVLPVLAVVDVLRGDLVLPRARLAAFAVWYLAWEAVAVVAAAILWPATGFGRAVDQRWSRSAHHRLQTTWVGSILAVARRMLRLELDIEGADQLGSATDGRPLIVLCRHASMVDTLVPAQLLFDRGYRVRYILKDELLWDPALDIIGHRLPNCFVDRSSTDMAAELDAIGTLAADAGPGEALVIFPEGTRWSDDKRQRSIERLHESDPALAARAERLTSTLLPRPAGTLALLAGRPDADVVIMGHTGLEGLAGPKDALRLLPLRRPMRVAFRRVARADVPTTPAAQRDWLFDRWDEVDAWIRAAR